MDKNSIIQIDSKRNLNTCYHGCLGFIEALDEHTVKVGIYHPGELGHKALVQKMEIPRDNVVYIGEPKFKPLP